MPKGIRLTKNDFYKIAEELELTWLDETNNVPTANDKLSWMCKNGHEIKQTYTLLLDGYVCSYCSGFRLRAEDFYTVAEKTNCEWTGDVNNIPLCGEKTTWLCLVCNYESNQPYDSKKQGIGCPSCSGKLRLTAEDYKNIGEQTNCEWIGNKIENCDTKTLWRCYFGHEYYQTYTNKKTHNQGCPRCAGVLKKNENDYNICGKRQGGKWVGKIPNTTKEKTEWECSKGHIWEASFGARRMGGCPVCYGNKRIGIKEITELAEKTDVIWIGEELPKNNSEKTNWKCKQNNHVLFQSFAKRKQAWYCSECNSRSKGEKRIIEILERICPDQSVIKQAKFDGLLGIKNGKLSYDFFIPNKNLLIEFHGGQHYKAIEYFGGEERFQIQQEHDLRKEIFAEENNYTLLIFNDDMDIEEILYDLLGEKNE